MSGWRGAALVWLLLGGLAWWLVSERGTSWKGGEEAWLAYALDDGDVIRFAVTGPTTLRLNTWLETSAPWAPDARQRALYRVHWQALDGQGVAIGSGETWGLGRASWIAPEQPTDGLVPVAIGPDPARRLWDPRGLRIEVPEGTRQVEVWAGARPRGSRVLFLAFEREARDSVEQLRGVAGTDAVRAAELAARFGPYRWEELPTGWRAQAYASGWRRLASTEQQVRPVRVSSGSGWLPDADAAAVGFALPAGGAASYVLRGEQRFEAAWVGPDGFGRRAAHTWVEILGEGLGDVVDLGVVERIGPFDFGPGVREVRIARDPSDGGDVGELLRAWTTGARQQRSWGDPPRRRFGEVQLVAPDLKRLQAWRTEPDQPLVFDIPADTEVRVSARPRLGPGALPGLGPGTPEGSRVLELTASGPQGWTVSLPLQAIPSAHERYTLGDDPATARVADETEWFLAAQDRPFELDLRGDAIDVQVFVKERAAPSDVPSPGYDEAVVPDQLRVRYLPYDRRSWRVRAPNDADGLAAASRAVGIDAQVRWVARARGGASGLTYSVVELPPPFDLVAEPRAEGTRSRLTREPVTVTVPDTGRALVDYKVAPSQVGRDVAFRFGERVEVRPLLSASGTLRFERLPPGPTQASVDAAGVFLATAPGGRPWGVRRVWRLDPGQQRRVRIPARGEGLSVHVARRELERSGVVRWEIVGDGIDGLPIAAERRSGRVALLDGSGRAEVLTRAESSWVWAEPIRLWLDERLHGDAELVLTLEERATPVWIWVSATWAPAVDDGTDRHWVIPGVGE